MLRTPRSGRTLAFRVTIALDPSGGRRRARHDAARRANRPLNHWLAQHLPALNTIGWAVRNGTAAPVTVTVTDVGVQPLDLVLMSGNRLGDRVERAGALHHPSLPLCDAAVADDVTTIVVPEPATRPSQDAELRFRNSRRGRHQPREASSPANAAARDGQPIAAACMRSTPGSAPRRSGSTLQIRRAPPRATRRWSTSRILPIGSRARSTR